MAEPTQDQCGNCGAEIDESRRVDFTLKNGTRVCDSCFVRATPAQPTRRGNGLEFASADVTLTSSDRNRPPILQLCEMGLHSFQFDSRVGI